MQLRARLVLLTVLLLGVAVVAQTPAQSPCASADLRASMAESNLAAMRLESTTRAVRHDLLERELAETKGRLSDTSNRLGVEQVNCATLASKNTEKDQVIVERDKTLLRVTGERDAALGKIARANRRWTCRVLHAGCIGER